MTIPKGTVLIFREREAAAQFKSAFLNEVSGEDHRLKNADAENVVLLKENVIAVTQAYLTERDEAEFALHSRIVELEAMVK